MRLFTFDLLLCFIMWNIPYSPIKNQAIFVINDGYALIVIVFIARRSAPAMFIH